MNENKTQTPDDEARTRPLRVMIVDDSATMRGLLRQELSEGGLEVVAQASNGRLALPRIGYYRPDVILLDVEMPELDGLETLAVIRRDFPEVQAIMFSSRTEKSARHTIRALEMGAVDFVTKPVFERDGDPGVFIRDVIREKILHLRKPVLQLEISPVNTEMTVSANCAVCGIGVSTGGPVALRTLFAQLPANLPGSIVVVQHMPPVFTRMLAESLATVSRIPVREGTDGAKLLPGTAWIAPGGFQTRVVARGGGLELSVRDEPAELNCRPSVNVLFRSLATAAGSSALGIIMTGMGNDGFEGLKAMKAAGATLLAQSRESCLIYGMPALPVQSGLISESQDVPGLARRIAALLGAKQ